MQLYVCIAIQFSVLYHLQPCLYHKISGNFWTLRHQKKLLQGEYKI